MKSVALSVGVKMFMVGAVASLAACGGSVAPSGSSTVVTPAPSSQPSAAPSHAPLRETPDAPFRAGAPDPGATSRFVPPVIEDFTLRSGLRVLLVERHDLPVVVAEYVTRRGGDDVATDRAGLASLVGALLEMGTTHRNALELSDAYAALGAEHGSSMGYSFGVVFAKVLSSNLVPTLEILADIVQHPAFAAEEIERARSVRLAALQQEVDSPAIVAANVGNRVVYGDRHPYGFSPSGTPDTVRAINEADIRRFYATHYVPAQSALVVVGDVTRAALTPMVDQAFGAWQATAPRQRAVAAPPSPATRGPRVFLVERAGAPQSVVSVTQAGVARTSPDYLPLSAMNTILGGTFSSRINLNLRETHAFTYGARSAFQFRRGAGPFTAGGAIITAHTAEAVHEILVELERMRSTDVTVDELSLAKARLAETLPSRFETTDETASAVAELFAMGLPLNDYATLGQRIQAVTVADVRRVAMRYLAPATARIVVVGDHATVAAPLSALNIGAVESRGPRGETVAP